MGGRLIVVVGNGHAEEAWVTGYLFHMQFQIPTAAVIAGSHLDVISAAFDPCKFELGLFNSGLAVVIIIAVDLPTAGRLKYSQHRIVIGKAVGCCIDLKITGGSRYVFVPDSGVVIVSAAGNRFTTFQSGAHGIDFIIKGQAADRSGVGAVVVKND